MAAGPTELITQLPPPGPPTLAGRDALAALLASEDDFDPEMFTPADHAALAGDWKWISIAVDPALAQGMDGLIDDALATVRPWGVRPRRGITTPVLLVHGTADRMMPSAHSEWLARRICSSAELVLVKDAGHISVLLGASDALAWLAKLGRQADLCLSPAALCCGPGDGLQALRVSARPLARRQRIHLVALVRAGATFVRESSSKGPARELKPKLLKDLDSRY